MVTKEMLKAGLFLENNVLNVGRIFVAPEHFRKGYESLGYKEITH